MTPRAFDGDRTSRTMARNRDHLVHPGACDRASDDRIVRCGEMTAFQTDGAIVYKSAAIRSVLTQLHQVAPTSSTVLLLGETGVGKEIFAQALHDASPRRHRPMIRVSCAALPATLIESKLFGHERGAFTTAVSRQIGRFEAANGSTLFLDEIGERRRRKSRGTIEDGEKAEVSFEEGQRDRKRDRRAVNLGRRTISAGVSRGKHLSR
jgi:transcriptional regulator with GAF, ATPase, and Fis domain